MFRMSLFSQIAEPPPTAGLPAKWSDLLGTNQALEHALATWLEVPEVQIESSGTAALLVALLTLKRLDKRRKVIITAYTCPWVLSAVLSAGLQPVLCDVNPQHFSLNMTHLQQLVDETVLAIVPTHLAGRVHPMEALLALAKRLNCYVVEDAAQSLGATLQGRPVGTFGDIGFYSLGVGKGLTMFAGGVLVAQSAEMRAHLQQTHAQVARHHLWQEVLSCIQLVAYTALYHPLTMPLVYGMALRRAVQRGDYLNAVGDICTPVVHAYRVSRWRKSVAAQSLKRLSAYFLLTSQQASQRVQRLKQIQGLTVLTDEANQLGVWPFIFVVFSNQQQRDAVLAKIWHKKLGVGRLFIYALNDYKAFAPYLTPSADATSIHVPNAQQLAETSLVISNSHWLSETQFDTIYAVIQRCCATQSIQP